MPNNADKSDVINPVVLEQVERLRDLEIDFPDRTVWGFKRPYEHKNVIGLAFKFYTEDEQAPERFYFKCETNLQGQVTYIAFGPFCLNIDNETGLACFSLVERLSVAYDFLRSKHKDMGLVELRKKYPNLAYFDEQLKKPEVYRRGFSVPSIMSFLSDKVRFTPALDTNALMEIFTFNGADRSRDYYTMDERFIFPLSEIKKYFYNFVMLTGILTPNAVDKILKDGELTFENIIETLRLEPRPHDKVLE